MVEPASPLFDSDTFLASLPNLPGVYQMYDKEGTVIYVGKAVSLKARLSSYFKRNIGGKTKVLVEKIASIKVTTTASETEALLLESNLIKKYRPRYNIVLRDDKSYPFILVTDKDKYPRLVFYRGKKIDKSKGTLFGPFPSILAVKEVLTLLQRVFSLRTCRDSYFRNRTRPCLEYQIGRCSGPCVGLIKEKDYQKQVKEAMLFLSGKSQALIKELEQAMQLAAAKQAFEQAAILRDRLTALNKIREKQFISMQAGEADVIACVVKNGLACIGVSVIREGEVLASETYFPSLPAIAFETLDNNKKVAIESIVLEAFLVQYYTDSIHVLPNMLVCPQISKDSKRVQFLQSQKRRLRVITNPRSHHAKWYALAHDNTVFAHSQALIKKSTIELRYQALADILHLSSPIKRIECFDVSHTQGNKTVASCVVFNQEGPVNSLYRLFNITDITPGDDYAAMAQVLRRRYKRQKDNQQVFPDVLLIDGGKGQIEQAKKVLEDLDLKELVVLGVAKGPKRIAGLEKLILASTKQELDVSLDSPARHLIQHVRDEAHRFAIEGHRRRRAKPMKTSILESIEGIGAKKRQALIQHFGGLKNIKAASLDDLKMVPGISHSLAEKIYQAVHE